MKIRQILMLPNKLIIFLIRFYQKYLTVISFGSCRYHPTCSSYTIMQFEHNNFFKAILLSAKRVLSCNSLFEGGFDYVKIKCPNNLKQNLKFKKIKVEYWLIPTGDKNCLIIKHNKKWDK